MNILQFTYCSLIFSVLASICFAQPQYKWQAEAPIANFAWDENDTTINNGLKLWVYEDWKEFSVEKFANCSFDDIPILSITESEQMPLPIHFQKYRYENFSIFINNDTTEVLLAGQGPGLSLNKYDAFYISNINKENEYILTFPQCVYTHYDHFITNGGCHLGMTKEELLSIKGNSFSVLEDGNWEYSYLSNPDDKDILEFYKKSGKGDVIWEFFFKDDVVVCFFIASIS